MSDLTNKQICKTSELFRKACELAGIEPTPRQASRFLNHNGKAYKFYNAAKKELTKQEKPKENTNETNKIN